MTYSYRPTSVEIISNENEISWKTTPSRNVNFLLESRWSTVRSLKHIANSASGNIRERTQALICTNFQIDKLPDIITGLEVKITAQRNGRIADEIIQLTYQGNPIGANNFIYLADSEGHIKITNETIYGNPTDLWGTELTPDILTDPSFGIILKFQSHPYFPHNVGISLDEVLLTVY